MISQSAKNCIITGWCPLNPYYLSGCLCCSSKSIEHVLAKDVPILTLRCNSRATALWTVWHAVRCMATSSQALNSAYIAIKCISIHLWPLSSMKSSNGLLHRGNTRHQSLNRIDNKTNMIFLIFQIRWLCTSKPCFTLFLLCFRRCTNWDVQCIVIDVISKCIQP